MSYPMSRCVLVCLLSLWLFPVVGRAQVVEAERGTVSGIGSTTVKQKATLVRMTVQLEGKGKTLKEALSKLKDRREAAVLQLQTLGAKKESIVASDPGLSAGESDQQRQIQRMMIQQLRASGRAPKPTQTAKTVSISSTLTAEWPLTGKTQEDVLTFAHELQNKVEAADLAGLKEPKKLTPEEAELQDELAQAAAQYGGYDENQPKPGVPQFAYIARVSEPERDKAIAAAFEKAKKQAEKLAAAAGAKLGNLSSLNGTTTQANESNSYGRNAYAMQMMMMAQQQGFNNEGANDEEGFSPQPGLVTFQVVVNATFKLK